MKFLKRLVVLAVGSLLFTGCALLPVKTVYVMFPVEQYQFITSTGDTLTRAGQPEVKLPVDGVWMSLGEKDKYEDAQEYAVERGYILQ